MRNKIELKKGAFLINGRPFFMYSGEMHYFRIPRVQWEDRIIKAKEAGLNTVSSYIPWGWHEPKEGKTDLSGATRPERDLAGFIKLIQKHGLYFFCRPGPITHGEIKSDGKPVWLTENYPEIRLKKQDGSDFDPVVISYMNPTYLKYVEKWYAKVMPIIAKNQFTSGGNVIAVQLDNEISMINWLSKQFDYSRTTTALYQDFLKEKYESIKNVNREYGTSYLTFNEIKQPNGNINESEMMCHWDWALFCRRYYALFYKTLADKAKRFGINVPLVANIAHFYDYSTCGRGIQGIMTSSMFRDFRLYVPEVIFGGAYQMRRLDFENFHDVAILSETVKMITKPGVPSFVVELQTGIMNDRPRLYPSDVDLNLKTSTAHGLNGLNCYMFCGGTTPKELASRSSYHEWQAPITSEGRERPHLQPIREFGDFLRSNNAELAATKKVYDLSVGVYMPYYMTEYLRGPLIDRITGLRDFLFFDGIGRLLILAGLNFNMLDIERVSQAELNKTPYLCVFSLDFMDKATQVKLVEYVKEGGKLIINYQIPEKDLSLKPETYLRDWLGIKGVAKSGSNLIYFEGKDYMVEGGISILKTKNSKILAKTFDGNKPCAIKKKIGKGEIMVVGFGLPHVFDYHIDITRKLCQIMGISAQKNSASQDLHFVKRAGDKVEFDFILNYHDEPKATSLNGLSAVFKNRSAMIIKNEK